MYSFATPAYQARRARTMARAVVPGAIVPTVNRCHVPSSAAPEKCKLEMPIEEFRSWNTSMQWWLRLNAWRQSEAVGYIRLSCTPDYNAPWMQNIQCFNGPASRPMQH